MFCPDPMLHNLYNRTETGMFNIAGLLKVYYLCSTPKMTSIFFSGDLSLFKSRSKVFLSVKSEAVGDPISRTDRFGVNLPVTTELVFVTSSGSLRVLVLYRGKVIDWRNANLSKEGNTQARRDDSEGFKSQCGHWSTCHETWIHSTCERRI